MIDYYEAAAQLFQEDLNRIEREGRKDVPEWQLVNGLLLLAQGLKKEDRDAKAELRKGFARSWVPPR
jgi:hypothetical protein